jgi:hypothetical protein
VGTWATKVILLFLVYERLDSESPQQKPLDGEAFALMQTRASETWGLRIEAKENVFPGDGFWGPRLKYLKCPRGAVFYRQVQNF